MTFKIADEIGCDRSTVAKGNLNKLADRAERGKLKGNGDNRLGGLLMRWRMLLTPKEGK